MNLLADKMIPYLDASGIPVHPKHTRHDSQLPPSPPPTGETMTSTWLCTPTPHRGGGTARRGGILVFYYPGSQEGERAATIIANNLKEIYPLPELVQAQPTTTIGEVRRVRAPSAFLELGYHDNPEDAAWIKSSLDAVAKNLVMSLTDYFDIPFLLPQPSRPGQVDVDWGVLNIRARPELGAPILVQAPDGAPLTVLNSTRRLVSGGLLRNSGLRQTGFYHIDLTPPERRFLWTSMWFSRETPCMSWPISTASLCPGSSRTISFRILPSWSWGRRW